MSSTQADDKPLVILWDIIKVTSTPPPQYVYVTLSRVGETASLRTRWNESLDRQRPHRQLRSTSHLLLLTLSIGVAKRILELMRNHTWVRQQIKTSSLTNRVAAILIYLQSDKKHEFPESGAYVFDWWLTRKSSQEWLGPREPAQSQLKEREAHLQLLALTTRWPVGNHDALQLL